MTALRCLRFSGREPSTACVVLLPAAFSTPEDVVAAEFPATLHSRFPRTTLLLPEIPVGDLRDRDGLAALRAEVVAPVCRTGIRPWLAGISLGGYLSLLYARRWPEDVAGMLLMAPYLGNRGLARSIAVAGGARAWLADARELDRFLGTEEERGVWRLLAEPAPFPVRMGYGREDRFAGAHRLAAELLPPSHVAVVEGGHDWQTWKQVWKQMLPSLEP